MAKAKQDEELIGPVDLLGDDVLNPPVDLLEGTSPDMFPGLGDVPIEDRAKLTTNTGWLNGATEYSKAAEVMDEDAFQEVMKGKAPMAELALEGPLSRLPKIEHDSLRQHRINATHLYQMAIDEVDGKKPRAWNEVKPQHKEMFQNRPSNSEFDAGGVQVRKDLQGNYQKYLSEVF